MRLFILSITTLLLSSLALVAQPDYQAAMQANLAKMDGAEKMADLQAAANTFERIGKAEADEWLPEYYATLSYINLGWWGLKTGGGAEAMATMLDKAQAMLNAANAKLDGSNSELHTLQGYIYQARVQENPMANGPKYTTKAMAEFNKASSLDPTNPRPHYLTGQHVFYMPEAFGGGKAKAKPHLEKAKELFAAQDSEDALAPRWGAEYNAQMLAQYDEN